MRNESAFVFGPTLIRVRTCSGLTVMVLRSMTTSRHGMNPGAVVSCRIRKTHFVGLMIVLPVNDPPSRPTKAHAHSLPSIVLLRMVMLRASKVAPLWPEVFEARRAASVDGARTGVGETAVLDHDIR